jgi:hypothetical protein
MGATLDLYIDTSSGALIDGGSVVGGSLPTLTRNDSYTFRLRLLEKNPNGSFDDIDLTSSSLKVGIGNIEEVPSDGNFKLNVNGVTSGDIPYNATAVCLYNAVSNNVSTVSLYGGQAGYYLLTASQPNTAMSFNGDVGTLFPSSSVLIGTRRNPTTSVNAQQTIQLVQNPVVYADTFTNAPTADEIKLNLVANGGTASNETYELLIGPLVRGGLFSLNFGGNSTTGIAPFTSAITVQTQLAAVTGIGSGNISVQENGKQGYTIQFVRTLGLTNIATLLNLDASGIDFLPLKQTTLTMNTAELSDLFASEGTDTVTPTIEIELTQNGTPKTIYQGSVTIRKDLITAGSTVPGAQASYYTKAETDALFVEDSVTNVDASNRLLVANDTLLSCDYGNRQFYSNDGNLALDYTNGLDLYSSKIGFFGTSPIVKPSGANVVSNVISLGLISSSSTYGVLPGSIKTITTSVTLTFGTVAANDTTSVSTTITGSNINDIVLLGLPNALCAGLSFYGHVTTANVIEIDAVNGINSSRDQSAQTYRVTVIGY